MFFKWISDNWDFQHAKAAQAFGAALTDEIKADYQAFQIPDGCHWDDVFETVDHVGSKLGQTLLRIQEANAGALGRWSCFQSALMVLFSVGVNTNASARFTAEPSSSPSPYCACLIAPRRGP